MNSNPAPNFALLASSIDFSSYATKPFSRGATAITGTWSSSYEDIISFLNGRGMSTNLDLSTQVATLSNFGTSWHVGIDANDKVEISCDVAFRIKFNSGSTITGLEDTLGIGTTFINSGGAGTLGPKLANAVTAPYEWLRGMITGFSYNIEQTSGGSNTFVFNFTGRAQDLVVACRSRGNSDIDDTANNTLEGEDVAATGLDTRWMIDDQGHVINSASVTISAITWTSTSLEMRNYLGFTGEEVPTSENFYNITRATYPCTGVLVPSRPYQDNHLIVDNVSQSKRKIGGGYASNFIGSYISSSVVFDLDARLDEIDLYRHFTNKFINHISLGERVNFYQVWGDSRRSLISSDANTSQPAHDLIYTSSRNGYEGRIRGSMTNSTFDLVYPTRLRRRVPVRMRIEHL